MNKNQIQHGDVLLTKVNQLPKGYNPIPRHNNLIIVAKGEATGHNHIIADKTATLMELKGDLYLEVTEPVTITHDEHKSLPIPEGIYHVGTVKEYDYFKDMVRVVSD